MRKNDAIWHKVSQEDKIIEYNKLIAKFVNVVWTDEQLEGWIAKELRYHSSWNQLMVVIEKISTLAINNFGVPDFVIHSDQTFIYDDDNNEWFINYVSKEGKLINAAYLTVVDFIKWYNTQEK